MSTHAREVRPLLCLLAAGLLFTPATWSSAAPPTARQALGLKPIQSNVDFDKPGDDQIDDCTIKPSKENGMTAWVVRDPSGGLLRRFSDTNGDNVVDHWSYYRNGLEVYRDIDADFDGKADEYRWFHSAGTRWGLDEDQNGKIDGWKRISPYEVAEVAVEAMQKGDGRLFATLLPSSSELRQIGLGAEMEAQMAKSIDEAKSGFDNFAKNQKTVTDSTRFLDFGASRPATIPVSAGNKQDVTVYENVAALVENGGKPEQVYLGTLVQMGDGWRLLGLPQLGDSGAVASLIAPAPVEGDTPSAGGDAPSPEMQELMARLEKLDAQTGGTPEQQTEVMKERIAVLVKLADASSGRGEREQWQRQQADMLSASVQTLAYYDAINQIEKLAERLKKEKASDELQAHVEFRRLWSEYIKAQSDPKADYIKTRDNWLAALEKFAEDYPNFADTAEALLQLGMEQEFAGEEESAVNWYTKLVKGFPDSDAGKKARGAIRRLDSIGKVLPLKGDSVRGGAVDLAGYRGKYVLIHYWATWCEPCKEDIEELKVLYDRYNRRGFEIIGVNLDSSQQEAQKWLASNRLPWKSLSEEGGLDGRLANEMGVMTLPLMLLVDEKGQVANRNVHISELENELKQALGRNPQVSRR